MRFAIALGITQIVFQTGLALMALHEHELLALPFEELLSTLSGKRFSTLTESADALLQTALAFECVLWCRVV